MAETPSNPWKLATFAIVLVLATAGITTLVVRKWSPSEPERSAAPAPGKRLTGAGGTGHGGQAGGPTAAPQPVSTAPSQAVIDHCNRYASAPPSERDKLLEIGKDALIGGAATAAVGAAAGAIAAGGKGAGKGAAIGGIVGAAAGTLYGINENRKADAEYRTAYATCMRARGYTT